MLARLIGFAFVAVACLGPATLFARTWKSADGKFTVDAEFVDVVGTEVKLKTAAGKEIAVPLSKLSTAARLFALAEKKKAATKKPEAAPADAPADPTPNKPAAGKGPDLAPLTFKFGDREYVIDLPRGAAVLPESRFPMLVITPPGSDARMLHITPHHPNNLKQFRQDFVDGSKENKLTKMLVEEEDAIACVSHIAAFDRDAPVLIANVTVGDRKLSVMHTDVLEERWKPDDALLLLKCAKTIRRAEAAGETPAAAPVKGKEQPTAPLTVTIHGKEYTVDAPVGAKVDPELVLPHVMLGRQLLFLIQPTEPTEMERFRQFFTETEGFVVKQKIIETDDTCGYVIHAESINATTPVFLTCVTVGGKKFSLMQNELGPTKLTAEDVPFLVKCARSLKAK